MVTSSDTLSLQDVEKRYQGHQVGGFDYKGGASGPLTVSGKVLSILVHSTTGGSFSINGGDTVPVPANVGLAFSPCGNLEDASFVFTGTDMYLVELAT